MARTDFFTENAPWLTTGVLLTFLSSFGQTFFISVFAGEIRIAYGLSHAGWGAIYSIATAVSALVMLWAGGLADRFRVRTLGPLVLIGLAVACVAMSANVYVALLPLVIFLLRLTGQGMCSQIAIVAMARWFVARRGRALAVAGLGFALGEAMLPVLFVWLMTAMDWRALWVAAAVVAVFAIFPIRALLKRERTPRSHAETSATTGMNGRHWTRKQALFHPLFWFMAPALLGPAAFNTAFFFHQVHFAEIKGWSHLQLAALFPVYTAMGVVAMLVSGALIDRMGTARLIPWFQLPMVAAFATFAQGNDPVSMLIGFLCLAMTTGANSTLPNAFWAEFYGTRHIGSIKAMAAAVMVFGSAIGPGLTGLLIGIGVGLETQFLGIAAYFVMTTGLMVIGVAESRRALV
ncbi:MFS transporter [Thalassococcus sp. CAU 1522]|uniref:MFS transporter n=1 Tax=Thalassococcus arenae TaxID=2851652 RepID=A0ABS6N7A8_9RHOB|nr:MFS transporter [Thalassococcus arenae]MBV2359400.1 MFS transporter [Thalassococcus arenae]